MEHFTRKSILFLDTAGKQTSVKWLDLHAEEQEEVLTAPLRDLAEHLYSELADEPAARGYKFTRSAFSRIKRPSHKVGRGEPAFRNWVHLRAARPLTSRFDDNPSLYFYMSKETTFAGGGLYEPSSRQIKQMRAWLAEAPPELPALLKSAPFKKQFPRGLETEKRVKTFPRSYAPDHAQIELLRLQAYYVKREFTKQELTSSNFAKLVTDIWRQTLRLNAILAEALKRDLWQQIGTPETEEVEPADQDLWDDRL